MTHLRAVVLSPALVTRRFVWVKTLCSSHMIVGQQQERQRQGPQKSPRQEQVPQLLLPPFSSSCAATATAAALTTTTTSQVSRRFFSATSTGTTTAPTLTTTCPSVAGDWLDVSTGTYKYFSDNTFHVSNGSHVDGKLPVIDPATGTVHGHVPEMTSTELDTVLNKAQAAFEEWRWIPVQHRQRMVQEFLKLVTTREHQQVLVRLITAENGKTFADAAGDVFRGVEVVETACQVATHLLGDSFPNVAAAGGKNAVDIVSYREPLGVVAGICPFNFPVMIPLWMFPLAIACGNTCILKPSEKTPSAALYLAHLTALAGFPPNVLQMVHGSTATVSHLCRSSNPIQAISFVGSTAAGKAIHAMASTTSSTSTNTKRVQANLGAKNHAIVLPDCWYDETKRKAVVQAISGAAFGAAGQRCMALSVVILVEDEDNTSTGTSTSLASRWIPELVAAAQRFKVGPGYHADTDVGPLITAAAKERTERIITTAVEEQGAILHLDGRRVQPSSSLYSNGNYVGPTILQIDYNGNSNESLNKHICYTEEIFGPVLIVVTGSKSLQDAVQNIINANPYGNGTALFTNSAAAARYFTHHVQAGQVGINVPIPVPLPMFSFTGNKASIAGDINFYGKSGIQFYTQLKTVTSSWPDLSKTMSGTGAGAGSSLGGLTMPTMDRNAK